MMLGMNRRGTERRWAAATAVLVVFLGGVWAHAAQPWFTGDEPHYAIYARSLGEGWGVDLERAYEPGNRETILDGGLDPHARYHRGEDGMFTTWHGAGLAVVLAPAMALHPTAWTARHVVLVLTGALAYHLVLLVRRVVRCPAPVAAAAAAGVLLAPPALFFGALVFPELPAALLLVIAARGATATGPGRRAGQVVASAAVGAALWCNLRYGLLGAGVLASAAFSELRRRAAAPGRSWRGLVALAVPVAMFSAALGAFNLWTLGQLTPEHGVGPGSGVTPELFRLDNLYFHGVGALLGFPTGILPFAPLLLAALCAIPLAVRWSGRGVAVLGVAALGYVGVNAYFGSPGFSVPGRYVVTAVPLLAVPLATGWWRGGVVARGAIAGLAALTALSVWTAASDFNRVYSGDRAGFEPMHSTARLWPFIVEDRRPSGWQGDAGDFESGTGRVVGGMVVAEAGRDEAGTVVFGPYVRLRAGRYVARFSLLNPGSATSTGSVDVHDGAVRAGAAYEIEPGAAGEIELPFTASGDQVIELRVHWDGSGSVAVARTEARLLEPTPGRRTEDEWWKAGLWVLGLAAVAFDWQRHRRRTVAAPTDAPTLVR
jgi:hypothetical protein